MRRKHMSSKFSIKTVVAIGIGSAVFIILGRFGSIPVGIPNTNVETAYAFLALMGVIFGPIAGLLIGLIGHTLKDMLFYGSPWFSWVIASGVFGLLVGLSAKKLNIQEGVLTIKHLAIFNIVQVIANAISWILIAPTLDIIIYAEPSNKVFVQGFFAFFANSLSVAILGSLLLLAYTKTRTKTGSLSKED